MKTLFFRRFCFALIIDAAEQNNKEVSSSLGCVKRYNSGATWDKEKQILKITPNAIYGFTQEDESTILQAVKDAVSE